MILSSRFIEALIYAARLHGEQMRKGTTIPYTAHLLGVTSLVLEAGGDEDQAIAALLHDAVEDQGGIKTLEIIRDQFGDRVAAIVEGCSDSFVQPKPPWLERKQSYLDHLPNVHPDVRLVSLADKLHNARSILRDLREGETQTFKKFRGGKEGTLWYYTSLVSIYQELDENYMVQELARVVEQIIELANRPQD